MRGAFLGPVRDMVLEKTGCCLGCRLQYQRDLLYTMRLADLGAWSAANFKAPLLSPIISKFTVSWASNGAKLLMWLFNHLAYY